MSDFTALREIINQNFNKVQVDNLFTISFFTQLVYFIVPIMALASAIFTIKHFKGYGGKMMIAGSILLFISQTLITFSQSYILTGDKIFEYPWLLRVSGMISLISWIVYFIGLNQVLRNKHKPESEDIFL